MAAGFGGKSLREYLQGFFIRLSAGYRRISKRPKGKPSPQLYAYKTEKPQELVQQERNGLIDLYYGDESHICTEGYVPYGRQFRDENMTADKVSDFLDLLSLHIVKNTCIVLDNATVHRCKLMRELRPIWEKRGLFLFFLPPYSPHMNIAETLWRILKGKLLRPADYRSTDFFLYATDSELAALGAELNINFAHAV